MRRQREAIEEDPGQELAVSHALPQGRNPQSEGLQPWIPLLFCASSAYLLYASLARTGLGALVGLGALAAGLPFLLIDRRLTSRAAHRSKGDRS